MRVEPCKLGLEKSLGLEWVLANGLGGYSASTVLGLNTRKYHGMLVASLENLRRMVCLQRLDDVLLHGGKKTELHCIEYGGGTVVSPGLNALDSVRRGLEDVCFVYETPEFRLEKTVAITYGRNAVAVFYRIHNKTNAGIKHEITPHVNWRGIHELSHEGKVKFKVNNLSVQVGSHTLYFKPSEGSSQSSGIWIKNIYYRKEAERGYESVEEALIPFKIVVDVPAGVEKEYNLSAALDDNSFNTMSVRRIIGKYDYSILDAVESSARSFVINLGRFKSVIAGYYWFGEWGRDAMISLPGFTLVNSKFDEARLIFERFLCSMNNGRIMTESDSGAPVYRDFDSTLWAIDRIKEYLKYVGLKDGKPFLEKYWGCVFDALKYYGSLENDGLIPNTKGTWMDTLKRDNAVEVQALWYNALKSALKMSEQFDLELDLEADKWVRRFESHFMAEYWNGSFLRDCVGDESFRPNQVIALSLDYNCVPREHALSILKKVDELLLTPYGLRTLSPKDGKYKGKYVGGVSEREFSYHNGTVWPWLLGPYFKACVKYRGVKEAEKAQTTLENFFRQALNANALGSLNEIYDGDHPHLPGGCVSQAWSVAEPLRAYYEDVLGSKPKHAGLFLD